MSKETLDILYEIVSDGNPISKLRKYEEDEIKREQYKTSFGIFLDIMHYSQGDIIQFKDQFASKNSVFDKESKENITVGDKRATMGEVLQISYEKSFWHENTLEKFAASIDDIRKFLV